jgi:allantoicase
VSNPGQPVSNNAIASFTDLIDLASERLGGAAIACSNDFFAGMDALVKSTEAVWDEHRYVDTGKWMDGWESKRSHRENHENDHEDWCVVRLGAPGVIRGVVIDTAWFRGNFPSHAALEGIAVEGYPAPSEIAQRTDWVPLLAKSALEGNHKNAFDLSQSAPSANGTRFTHVRLRIFPDGGVARLRVFGEPLPDWRIHGGLDNELELSSAELGGIVTSCSDMFFGSRHNLLFPGSSGGMHDGWETRRSRRQGSDWAVVQLAAKGTPTRIVVDTSHFKGNCPESFSLERSPDGGATWSELHPRTELRAHTKHVFAIAPAAQQEATHVRLRVFPDGGVARFRLFGRMDDREKERQRVRRIDAMTPHERDSFLRSCCGARAWVREMSKAAPYGTPVALHNAAAAAFGKLGPEDWLEAFSAHPRIGGSAKPKEGAEATGASKQWSGEEQRGVAGAADDVKARLAAKNDEYFLKNGFIFIVMATGKTAEEMLAILEQRLQNPRDLEIQRAGSEQAKITSLRLRKIG